jgi:serine/threonine protein kinase
MPLLAFHLSRSSDCSIVTPPMIPLADVIPSPERFRIQYLSVGEETPESGWNATRKSVIALGLAAGMAYLHSQNIVHRNISGGSVYVDSDGGLSSAASVVREL